MTTLPIALQRVRQPLRILSYVISSCQDQLDEIHTKTGEYPTAQGWDIYGQCLEHIRDARQRHPTLPSTPSLPTTITPAAALAMIGDWCEAPAIRKGVAPPSIRAVEPRYEAYKPAGWFIENTDIPAACFPFLEFLETCHRSGKPPVEEKEIPEDLRLDDVVVWCKGQDLISIERRGASLKGPARSIYRITDQGLATLAGQRLRIDANDDGGGPGSDHTIRAQSDPCEQAKKDGSAPPLATAAEAVAYLGDDWATIKQLGAVTGKTPSAIRSAFYRAKSSGEFLPEDELKISDAGPGQPQKRFRIKGVWRHISCTSSARLKNT